MKRLLPPPLTLNARERFRIVIGTTLGVLLVALVGLLIPGANNSQAALIAPLGASAVLLFALATGPLAQPWAVVAGNTVSALVGVACVNALGDARAAAPLAVGLAIAAMFALRCLHPPGGAMALLAVLNHQADYGFVLYPVALGSLLLVLAAFIFHTVTRRPYLPARSPPSGPGATAGAGAAGASAARFSAADIDAVLARHNQLIDISAADLESLLSEAEMMAYQRRLGGLRCADVMTSPATVVQFGDSLADAWALMRDREIKALPVVDRAMRIAGIITTSDFLRHAGLDLHDGLGQRLREFVRKSGQISSDNPEVVGQIMTRKVRVASADRPLAELVPLFGEHGHHHLPIVDAQQRVVGIITQTDVVRTLSRGVPQPD